MFAYVWKKKIRPQSTKACLLGTWNMEVIKLNIEVTVIRS